MSRVATFVFLFAAPILLRFAFAADPSGGAVTVDLSDPLRTYGSYLDARLADDLPSILKCVTAAPAKQKAINTLLANEVAKHELETAAIAKWGADASKTILDTQRPIQDELQARKVRLARSRPDIDKDGGSAVLYLRAERNLPDGVDPFNDGIYFVKVGNDWKIDGVKYLHQDDQGDPDVAQTQLLGVSLAAAMTDYMNTLTAGIKKGSYRSADQVRALLDAKLDTFDNTIPTGTTTSAPAAPADGATPAPPN